MCPHRSMCLFELPSREPAHRIAFTKEALTAFERLFPGEGDTASRLTDLIALHGRLLWHPPNGHAGHPGARFHILADTALIPMAWRKTSRVPLLALAVESTHKPLLTRLVLWLRRRFSLRIT